MGPVGTFQIPRGRRDVRRITIALESLPPEKAYKVTVEEAKPKRSLSQNALLWALYEQIIAKGGEDMQGWTKGDLHDWFLMNHFGHEVATIFGRKKYRPLRRSSALSKTEFSDYVDSIVRFMAERGVILDLPEGL